MALLATVVAVTITACTTPDSGIRADIARRATVTELVDVSTSVTARAIATLTAPAEGTVSRLAVAPGSAVAKGAVVAVIDSPTARKRLADARAALSAASQVSVGGIDLRSAQKGLDASALAALRAARSAANQVSDPAVRAALLAQVAAAQQQMETAARTSQQLVEQVNSGISGIGGAVESLGAAQRAQAKAAYDLAKSTVDSLVLRAPFAGVVQFARPVASTADPLAGLLGAASGSAAGAIGAGAISSAGSGSGAPTAGVDDMLAVGDQVAAGTAVVTIVDASEISLTGDVDETDVLLVKPGITASVELDAAPGQPYEATVRSVDLLPSSSARGVGYRVRLAFTPAPEATGATPRPGMSAVAHLRVRTATNAVSVPAAAVFTTDAGPAVWVVRDGKAVRQKVAVGVPGEDLVEITAGLESGERVVVAGVDKVTEGVEIT